MNTLGWLLILAGIIVGRAVMKGRALQLPDDLGDAFLALVRGDTKEFTAVLARTGEGYVPAVGETGTVVGGAAGNAATAIVGQLNYKLGPVKAHVARAANSYGPRYGIKTIYGYSSSGSVPNSDHPKGLALDFMVSAKTHGGTGDALAAALVADPMVTYVIWNKKINNKNGKGWVAYSGPRDHTDHVHASFKAVG